MLLPPEWKKMQIFAQELFFVSLFGRQVGSIGLWMNLNVWSKWEKCVVVKGKRTKFNLNRNIEPLCCVLPQKITSHRVNRSAVQIRIGRNNSKCWFNTSCRHQRYREPNTKRRVWVSGAAASVTPYIDIDDDELAAPLWRSSLAPGTWFRFKSVAGQKGGGKLPNRAAVRPSHAWGLGWRGTKTICRTSRHSFIHHLHGFCLQQRQESFFSNTRAIISFHWYDSIHNYFSPDSSEDELKHSSSCRYTHARFFVRIFSF